MNDQELLIISTKFRYGLDKLKKEGRLPIIINSFPNGTCGTVTDSFIYHLKKNYSLDAECLIGKFIECTHTWCKVGDTYIDLTADQFNQYNFESIICCHKDDYPLGKYLSNIRPGISIFHPTANRQEPINICKLLENLNNPNHG